MEIILLIIVIFLIIIFQSGQNSKLGELESHLKKLESLLRKLETTNQKSKPHVSATPKPQSHLEKLLVTETEKPVKESPHPESTNPKESSIETTPDIIKEEEELIKRIEAIDEEAKEIEATKSPESDEVKIAALNTAPPIPVEELKIVPPVKQPEVEPVQPIKETPIKQVNMETPPPKHNSQQPTSQSNTPEDDWYTAFRKRNPDLEKFIGENILSKVAIAILVIGVAFFVKFAIDKNWINETARAGIGILCGGIVMGFAHRLHKQFKGFSSVLVAGGISIFYFTVGIAFHQYHLFGQTTAFILMFIITGFSVFISVAYDRIELATLSIIGGFATPFMVSTGEGNYRVLFTYILLLDMGMLVLAYLRKWNLINILTYCFTMLLYVTWLETKVFGDPRGPYVGALVFGSCFYVVFMLMNMVNNIRARRKFDAFEFSILLSNTFIFFGEGMHILDYYSPEYKGLFCAALALFNMVYAWLLYKKYHADEKLVYLMIGLTLTFITISAPVQLEGNHITLFWALEGTLLMWLAQKSKLVIYRFASVIVSAIAILSLFADWMQVYNTYEHLLEPLPIFLNKGFITGLVTALSLLATIFVLKKETDKTGKPYEVLTFATLTFHAGNYGVFLRIAFVILLYLGGLFELVYQLKVRLDGKLAFYIVLGSYHLLYTCFLNLNLLRYKSQLINKGLFRLNIGSLLLFIVLLATLPISEFRENLFRTSINYTGFIFHYLSVTSALFLAYKSYKMIQNKQLVNVNTNYFNPVVISIAFVYLCSLELVLHVLPFVLSPINDYSFETRNELIWQYKKTITNVVKIGFPILWGLLSFLFLSFGMKRHNKLFRICGLVLIAITVLKLFIYDMQNASEGGKIAAFIILGVVLLIISFRYQKIKALLKDDEQKEHEKSQVAK